MKFHVVTPQKLQTFVRSPMFGKLKTWCMDERRCSGRTETVDEFMHHVHHIIRDTYYDTNWLCILSSGKTIMATCCIQTLKVYNTFRIHNISVSGHIVKNCRAIAGCIRRLAEENTQVVRGAWIELWLPGCNGPYIEECCTKVFGKPVYSADLQKCVFCIFSKAVAVANRRFRVALGNLKVQIVGSDKKAFLKSHLFPSFKENYVNCFRTPRRWVDALFKADEGNENNDIAVFLIHNGSIVVASCTIEHQPLYNSYEVHAVCVNPKFRGKGMCLKMLRLVMRHVSNKRTSAEVKAKPLLLKIYCEAHNTAACRCYKRVFGKPVNVTRDFVSFTMRLLHP